MPSHLESRPVAREKFLRLWYDARTRQKTAVPPSIPCVRVRLVSSRGRVGAGLIRGVGRGVGLLALVVALAPLAALLLAARLDRGPGGEGRPTAFPLAL